MNVGLLGKKIGMTQIPYPEGKFTGVTAILVTPNTISMVKKEENDGYAASQLAFEDCAERKLNKPTLGHLLKQNISPKKFLREIKGMGGYSVGSKIDLSLLEEGEKIKITCFSAKKKGFAGPIKRHNKKEGPASHGSGYHRGVGSLCAGRNPNRTLKGKKMAGRMGGKKVSIINLKIIKIYEKEGIVMVKGGIPGPKNSLIKLCK